MGGIKGIGDTDWSYRALEGQVARRDARGNRCAFPLCNLREPTRRVLGIDRTPDLASWRAQAACQLSDHELFFPPEGEQGEYFRLRVSLAKRICASCPVRHQCADYAVAADERYGVLGGLTAEERAPAGASPRRGLTQGEGRRRARWASH